MPRMTCKIGACRSPVVSPQLGLCEYHAYRAEMGEQAANRQADAAAKAKAKAKAKR